MSVEPKPPTWIDRLLPVLLGGVVFAVASWASRVYPVGVFHDDGVYAILAKSLATGEGYRYLHIPGAPNATHYPPGYPLLLAGLWKLVPEFPQNIGVFLFANSLLLALTAWGTAAFARCVLEWPRTAAIAAAIVATLSYPLIMLSGLVLSEPLFAALLVPTLLGAERLARQGGGTAQALAVGAAAGGLVLVRTHAVALVVAIVVVLLVRRHIRPAMWCVVAAVVVVAPWQIWTAAHGAALPEGLRGSYGSYAAWLAEGIRAGAAFIIATIAANAREVGALLADRFSLSDHGVPRALSAALAAMLIGVGGWRASYRAPVAVAFLIGYLGILFVWPFTPWRFVFAIWPLAVLLLGEAGMWSLDLRARRVIPATLMLAGIGALALGAARQESRAYWSQSWRGPGRAAGAQIGPLVRWVSSKTLPDDLVAADGEQLVYLFTGRRAVPVAPFTAAEYMRPRSVALNATALRQLLTDLPVTYVLTIQPGLHAAAALLTRDRDSRGAAGWLVHVDSLPGGGVFRVERREGLPTQP